LNLINLQIMNKIIPAVLMFLCITLKISAQTVCTPDSSKFPKGTTFGILPDSLSANANVAYNQTMQFKFPSDSTYMGFHVVIDSVAIDSVSHFPKSFAYKCTSKTCTYKGGSYGCAVITGSPVNTEVGVHNLMLHFTVFVHSSFIPTEIPVPDSGAMKLTIHAHSGIFEQMASHKFEVNQNYPNPFTNNTEVQFFNPDAQPVYFSVMNEIGQQVYSKQVQSNPGSNVINFDRHGLPQGIYLYSIRTGNNIITRRMVIKD